MPRDTSAGRLQAKALPAAALLLLAVLVYAPALRAGFVWDDDYMLTESAFVKAPDGLKAIWFSTQLRDYFPLTSTSFWLEWRLWGMNAAGYHATNILLHAFSAVLLWRVLRLLRIPGAWLAAALFAVHPVNVESVAWITERKNTLAMLFYALSLWLYQKFESCLEDSSRAPVAPRKWYVLSLAAFILALLSKTAVVALPVVLLLCAWWRRGSVGWRDVRRALPFFVLALAAGLLTVWVQYHRTIGSDVVQSSGLAGRFATAGWAVWFYLYKAVVPFNLSFVYPRWEVNSRSLVAYLPAVALAACFLAGWRSRQTWGRPLLFGLGYIVAALFPALGFFNIYFQRYSLAADHWQYFSIIGVLALLVAVGERATRGLGRQWNGRLICGVFSLALIGLLGTLTWRQTRLYRDAETLWRDTLARNPKCWMAHNNLAVLLRNRGEKEEARAHYETALQLFPDNAEAHVGLGTVLAEGGQLREAIEHYDIALRLQPDSADAHDDRGNALAQTGDLEAAIAEHRAAIKLNPRRAIAHFNLANALSQAGKLEEAIGEYKAALSLAPEMVSARNNLANLLSQRGRLDEAIAQYREAIRLNPTGAEAHNNLGAALRKAGREKEGLGELLAAVELNPGLAETRASLAAGLEKAGRLDEALEQYREASRLRPDDARLFDRMGVALHAAGRNGDAETALRQAVWLEPRNAQAHYDLGNLLVDLGRAQEAIPCFRAALQFQPDLLQACVNLGDTWLSLGRTEEASACYYEALRISTNCFQAYNNLGLIQAAGGHAEEAIQLCRRALQISPNYPEAHFNLAHLLAGQQQWADAAAHYQQALRLNPRDPQAEFELGNVMLRQQQTNEALVHFSEALRLKPDFAEARSQLRRLVP